MAARRTVSGDLAEATVTIATLKAEVDEQAKKLKTAEQSRSYQYEQTQKAQSEVAELHNMLDMLPGAPGRELPPLEGQYSPRPLTLAARLIGYVAARSAA